MKHRILAVICALTLALTFGVFTGCQGSKGSVGYQLDMPQKGEEIAIMHTSMGDISIRFFPEAAPKAVENFKTHAKDGYYDGLTFHRVINDFMIQGGDPNGDGTGGDSIWGEPFEDEFSDTLFNIRGSLSMANSGPDTNGSQFFITLAPTPWLNGHHAIFGKVVEGMDIVRLIGVVPTDFRDRPKDPVIMETVEVIK